MSRPSASVYSEQFRSVAVINDSNGGSDALFPYITLMQALCIQPIDTAPAGDLSEFEAYCELGDETRVFSIWN